MIVPEAGGKVSELIDTASGANLLWQNPRIPLARTYAGAPFDDVWAGGWDDLFPTDSPSEVDGNAHHDHGDVWIGPWEWAVETSSDDTAVVRLGRHSASLPCRIDKWYTARRGSAETEVRCRLTNLGRHPVRFIWNQHIAHAIEPGSRLHLPAGRLQVVGPTLPRTGATQDVSWPKHEGEDLSSLPGPDAGVTEFLVGSDLREGWCVVTHPRRAVALRLGFDPAVFSTPWLWGVYGGWRGHHLVLTELCTSRPGGLADAIENGSAAWLAAGESLETVICLSLHADFDDKAPGDQDPTACTH